MKGWLVVNEFVNSSKFNEIFEMLQCAAKKNNIEIERVRGAVAWSKLAENDYDRIEGVDFVLFWDKDIKLAKAFENTGIRVFNSSGAIELCDDKAKTFLELKKHKDIIMPITFVSPKKFHSDGLISEDFIESIKRVLGFPCVIKECYGSFGQQVYLANSEKELRDRITEIGDRDYIVQEYIQTSCGRDIRVQVVGDRVVATMYRFNDGDFRANVTNGGKMKNYELNESQAETALKVCRYLGLDFAGVDILFGEDERPVVCEVNSNAHFKNLFDCTGIDASYAILEYIRDEMM